MFLKNGHSPNLNDQRPHRDTSWSLATRLTLWYTGSAFTLVALASGILYWVLVADLVREDDEELTEKARVLRELLHDKGGHRADVQTAKSQVEAGWASRQHAQIYARLRGDEGTIFETPGMSAILTSDVFPPPTDGPLPDPMDVRAADGKTFRILSVPIESEVNSLGGPVSARVIQVAIDRTPEMDLIEKYRLILWSVLAAASVACAVIGYQIAQRGVRPLRDITATAGRIGASRLDERLVAKGLPAELAELADTFNEMLHRLQESFSRLARFSADIAHELRTPTNNLRGEVEVALAKPRSGNEYREILGSCLEESVRLSRLIDDLLFLARAEHPKTQVPREPLHLARELAAIREFYEPQAAEAGVQLTLDAPEEITATLNKPLLQRALANLIDNALKHTPHGGTVTLSVRRHDGCIRIEVADSGGGIEPQHLPYLFERFYRVDTARASTSGGVGLGLAIVKGVAELHGGSATIASEVDQGTRVTLLFPV
jgi:two-component system heavy metal sensor histidine kinase CusS